MLAYGFSRTVKWTIDDEGILLFEPVRGEKGHFGIKKSINGKRAYEWQKYCQKIRHVKTKGKLCLTS